MATLEQIEAFLEKKMVWPLEVEEKLQEETTVVAPDPESPKGGDDATS